MKFNKFKLSKSLEDGLEMMGFELEMIQEVKEKL